MVVRDGEAPSISILNYYDPHIYVHHLTYIVYYYNYGWADYSAPSLESIMDVVKVMDFSCTEGKVAVHCHAGLGTCTRLSVCIAVSMVTLGSDPLTLLYTLKVELAF